MEEYVLLTVCGELFACPAVFLDPVKWRLTDFFSQASLFFPQGHKIKKIKRREPMKTSQPCLVPTCGLTLELSKWLGGTHGGMESVHSHLSEWETGIQNRR